MIEQARSQLEILRRLEEVEDDVEEDNKSGSQVEEGEREVVEESEGTGTEAAPPPSTAGSVAPTPVRPGEGLLKLIATNPLLAKATLKD